MTKLITEFQTPNRVAERREAVVNKAEPTKLRHEGSISAQLSEPLAPAPWSV
jgi:hypothetical protein